MLLELLVAVVVAVVVRWWWRWWRMASHLRLPEAPGRLPLLGHLLLLHGSAQHLYKSFEYMASFGDGIVQIFLGPIPYVMLTREHTVEPLLTSNSLLTKSRDYRTIQAFLGEGLVTSAGGKWKARRRLLTPAFHFKILDDFIDVYNKQAEVLVSKLEPFADSGREFNIRNKISLCTLDVIMESSMGWELGAQSNEEDSYVKSAMALEHLAMFRVPRPWLSSDFMFDLLGYGKIQRRHLEVFHGQSLAAIRRRKERFFAQRKIETQSNEDANIIGFKKRRAFLDLMLEESMLSGEKISDEELRQEVDTITFAGHDTTSTAAAFCLYFLGHHKDIQTRAYEEVMEVIGEAEDITTLQLKELRYLEACLKEAMRLCPPVPIIGREALEDLTIGGHHVPAGTTMLINMMLLHRDPKHFPEPEEYRPERFLTEGHRPPYAYVPFSAGPRNCIGQKFAWLMAKAIVAKVLRRFALSATVPLDRLDLAGQITLVAGNGIPVALARR